MLSRRATLCLHKSPSVSIPSTPADGLAAVGWHWTLTGSSSAGLQVRPGLPGDAASTGTWYCLRRLVSPKESSHSHHPGEKDNGVELVCRLPSGDMCSQGRRRSPHLLGWVRRRPAATCTKRGAYKGKCLFGVVCHNPLKANNAGFLLHCLCFLLLRRGVQFSGIFD